MIFTGIDCATSSAYQCPSDFEVTYLSRSTLIDYETKIVITAGEIRFYHKDRQHNDAIEETHPTDPTTINNLYHYLDSVKFLAITSPKREVVLDAPDERISATYQGRSNTVEFGGVRNLADQISTLRKRLFAIADTSSPRWQKEVPH